MCPTPVVEYVATLRNIDEQDLPAVSGDVRHRREHPRFRFPRSITWPQITSLDCSVGLIDFGTVEPDTESLHMVCLLAFLCARRTSLNIILLIRAGRFRTSLLKPNLPSLGIPGRALKAAQYLRT